MTAGVDGPSPAPWGPMQKEGVVDLKGGKNGEYRDIGLYIGTEVYTAEDVSGHIDVDDIVVTGGQDAVRDELHDDGRIAAQRHGDDGTGSKTTADEQGSIMPGRRGTAGLHHGESLRADGGARAHSPSAQGAASGPRGGDAPGLGDDFDEDADHDMDEQQSDPPPHPFSQPPEWPEGGHVHDCHEGNGPRGDAADPGLGMDADHGEDGRAVPRRRLTTKTSSARAVELGFPSPGPRAGGEEGYVTRETARAARLRHRETAAEHERLRKAARTTAWRAIRGQPEVASSYCEEPKEDDFARADGDPADAEDGPVVPARWMAHATHDVAAAPGAQIIFCRRCGAWTLGIKSMNLTRPCSMKSGHKGNLRLLSLGIAPRRGARVPAELKVAGARGTRGGHCVRRSSKRRGGR